MCTKRIAPLFKSYRGVGWAVVVVRKAGTDYICVRKDEYLKYGWYLNTEMVALRKCLRLLTELAEVAQHQPGPVGYALVSPSRMLIRATRYRSLSSLGVEILYLIEHPLLADYDRGLCWCASLVYSRPQAFAGSSQLCCRRLVVETCYAVLYVPNCLGLDLPR